MALCASSLHVPIDEPSVVVATLVVTKLENCEGTTKIASTNEEGGSLKKRQPLASEQNSILTTSPHTSSRIARGQRDSRCLYGRLLSNGSRIICLSKDENLVETKRCSQVENTVPVRYVTLYRYVRSYTYRYALGMVQ